METVIKMPRTRWTVEHRNAKGGLISLEEINNLVFDRAIEDMLAVYFKGQPQRTAWYAALINSGGALMPTDTASEHPGWNENTNYSAGQRPQIQFGIISDKRMSNSLNKAIFTMTAPAGNIAGVALISDAVKGGTSGLLYAGAPFNSVKNTEAGDTITVSVTVFGA